MIFSPKIYPKPIVPMILKGVKCQTRRLVKEGEEEYTKWDLSVFSSDRTTIISVKKDNKTKWQVGRDYAVQLGRGKPGLWYCPKCKETSEVKFIKSKATCGSCVLKLPLDESLVTIQMKPLRIKLTGIRKERLLDISEEDAKKEGFENRIAFLNVFYSLSKKFTPKYIGKSEVECEGKYIKISQDYGWNPEVWVLDFEVKK